MCGAQRHVGPPWLSHHPCIVCRHTQYPSRCILIHFNYFFFTFTLLCPLSYADPFYNCVDRKDQLPASHVPDIQTPYLQQLLADGAPLAFGLWLVGYGIPWF